MHNNGHGHSSASSSASPRAASSATAATSSPRRAAWASCRPASSATAPGAATCPAAAAARWSARQRCRHRLLAREPAGARRPSSSRPWSRVYAGMIVGENSRGDDLPCNPTKKKQWATTAQSPRRSTPASTCPRTLTLDSALEWIAADELVEVTPKSVRVRKAILSADERKAEFARRRPSASARPPADAVAGLGSSGS